MNKLAVTGKQLFIGKEIPVVLGGFGADKQGIVANMDKEENRIKLEAHTR